MEFTTPEDVITIAKHLGDTRHMVIGGGSNLLFMGDFDGVILHSAIKGVEVLGETEDAVFVRAGSGINWDEFVAFTVAQGWQGLENLSAIPGEVGASAVQNVGAYGVEAGEFIVKVDAVSLKDCCTVSFTNSDCSYGYRDSIFKNS